MLRPVIYRHHNRACEVEGIDAVLRGIKDHKNAYLKH